jgi:hypothetical protein
MHGSDLRHIPLPADRSSIKGEENRCCAVRSAMSDWRPGPIRDGNANAGS